MRHRHLEVDPASSAGELPSAAICDTLERGDLEDWKRLASAVAAEPRGALADRVVRLIDAYPMYGTSALWRAWIDRCRTRQEGPLRAATPVPLVKIRKQRGHTQAELAERIGISQSDLSKLERRRDVRLSTLRGYAAALGGRLRVFIECDGERTEVRSGGDTVR